MATEPHSQPPGTLDTTGPLHVLVPTLGKPHLVVALASIARQTLPLRPVVVDDRRGTNPPLEEMFPQLTSLPDTTVLVTGGVGLARARNTGLDAVGDAAVLLLDDDDVWCPHHAERLVAALAHAGPAPFAWSGCRVVAWGEGIPTTVTDSGFGWPDIRAWLWSTNFVPPSSVLVPPRARLRFDPDLTELEDWDAWLRLCEGTAGEPAFTGVVTMGFGRDIVAKGGMVMSSTFLPERQESMRRAHQAIAEAHPMPPGVPDRRADVQALRRDDRERAGAEQPLPFDYYERTVAGLAGPPISVHCCATDLARDYDRLLAARLPAHPTDAEAV
ncbi:glycosyltransferase family 2 protein [Streptomyces sp. NPDC054784]